MLFSSSLDSREAEYLSTARLPLRILVHDNSNFRPTRVFSSFLSLLSTLRNRQICWNSDYDQCLGFGTDECQLKRNNSL